MAHPVRLKYEHTLDLSEADGVEAIKAAQEYLDEFQFALLAALIEGGPMSAPELTEVVRHDARQAGRDAIDLGFDVQHVMLALLGLMSKGLVSRELMEPLPEALAAAIK